MKWIYRKIFKFIYKRLEDEIDEQVTKKIDDKRFWKLLAARNPLSRLFSGNDFNSSKELKEARLLIGKQNS